MSQPASAPAAATRFGRGAAQQRSNNATAARQPQLSVRDRQRHHMLTQWVEQLRSQDGAGGIHAVRCSISYQKVKSLGLDLNPGPDCVSGVWECGTGSPEDQFVGLSGVKLKLRPKIVFFGHFTLISYPR